MMPRSVDLSGVPSPNEKCQSAAVWARAQDLGDSGAYCCRLAMLSGWADHLRGLGGMSHWNRPVRMATDCSGTGAAELALADIAPGQFAPDFVFASDIARASQRWLRAHITHRYIFDDMVSGRSFQKGLITAKQHGTDDVEVCRGDLDVYVTGFPCTPFSVRNNNRQGFHADAAATFWATAKTISSLRPRVVVLENVPGLSRDGNLDKVLHALRVIKNYTVKPVLLNSKDFGVPQNRRRLYIMMLRHDAVRSGDVGAAFKKVIRAIVGAQCEPPQSFVGWFKELGMPLVPAKALEPLEPLESAIKCTCTSLVRGCALHRCFCRRCLGASDAKARGCSWRNYLVKYVQSPRIQKMRRSHLQNWRRVKKDAKLKEPPRYLDLLKMKGIAMQPNTQFTQREVATVETLSRTRNVMAKNVVFDASQNIDRAGLRDDGLVPTLTRGCSKIFVPSIGMNLSAAQCLSLQGFDVTRLGLSEFSDEELFSLCGNAMTVPVIGTILWAMLGVVSA